MTAEPVLYETIGAVRIVSFNRPEKLNAANLITQQQILAGIRNAAADKDARALILTGVGRAFSAGGDRDIIRRMAAGECNEQPELARVHVETIDALLRLEIPAIAAVNGFAIGYAAGLVALCDIVVMGEDAFLADPHVKYGMAATSAVQMIWPKLTSYAFAKEATFSGREVYAQEAVRIGLANRICPTGEERATALEIAKGLAELPPTGIAATKRAFNESLIEEAAKMGLTVGATR